MVDDEWIRGTRIWHGEALLCISAQKGVTDEVQDPTFADVVRPQNFRLQPSPAVAAARLGILFALTAVVGYGACLPSTYLRPPPPTAHESVLARAELRSVLLAYYDWGITRRPEVVTRIGVEISEFPPSPTTRSSGALTFRNRVSRLLNGPLAEAFTAEEYLALQTMQWELDMLAESQAFAHLDFTAIALEISPLRSYLEVLHSLPLLTAADAERYLRLLESVALWTEALRYDVALRRADRGITAHREVVEVARDEMASLRRLIANGAFRVADGDIAILDSASRVLFRTRERDLREGQLLEALDSAVAYLTRYEGLPRGREGLWRYPGGREYYRHLLRRHTGLEITPEAAQRVAALQLQRVDSLLRRMRPRVAAGSVGAVHDSLRRRARGQPWDLAAIARRVDSAQLLMADSMARIVAGPLPPRPTARAANAQEGFLWPSGALVRRGDDSTRNVLLTERWQVPDIALGAAAASFRRVWPGAALATEMPYTADSVLGFVSIHAHPGTAAGWAEYAGSLAGEMGRLADPLDAYLQLLHEGQMAALLAVDVGVHYFEMDRAQALAMLQPYTLAQPAAVESLFVKSILMQPGRAGAAALAAREFAALRGWIERELGPVFDRSSFHRRVLTLGSPPLPLIGSYLEWWAWNERRKAAEAAKRVPTRPSHARPL